MMSAAAATPSSPKENSNGGSSDAASASNIHPHWFLCDNLLNFSHDLSCYRIYSFSSETFASQLVNWWICLLLRQSVKSDHWCEVYVFTIYLLNNTSKLLSQFSFVYFNTASGGILDYPMIFLFRLVCVIIGSIFLHDCTAEPMLPIYLIVIGII